MDTFALQLSLETLLYDHFKEQFGTVNSDIGQVSRVLADAISRDSNLRSMPHQTICKAILSGPASSDFATLIKRIRSIAGSIQETTAVTAPSDKDREATGWGLFLKCFIPFTRHQDLLSVKDLTVCFTADWLISTRQYINDDEIAWCKETAEKNDNLGQLSPNYRNAFSEAVVTITCRKFLKSLWTNQQKTRDFLSERKREYEAYCKKRYGSVPEWNIEESNTTQYRCRSLKYMKKMKPEDFRTIP